MIIPIGTKSTLALKPKLTIGIIAANVIIAIITTPMMIQSEKNLFQAQRGKYACQARLYLAEHQVSDTPYSFVRSHMHETIGNIENAEDYLELEIEIAKFATFVGATLEEIEEFERELLDRTAEYYDESEFGIAETFREWRTLKAREERIVSKNVIHSLGLIPRNMNRIHTFFTHIFLHAGLWHLLGNMIFLWVVGCLLEDTWGRLPFFVFYLAGGAVAGLAHCSQDTTSGIPMIGASGAIAAAMGAFAVRHFWTRIKFFYFFWFFFRPVWGTFHLPAFVFLPFWCMQQIAMKYLTDYMGGSSIAYLAHIGGFFTGAAAAALIRFTGFENRYLNPIVQRKQIEAGVLKDPRFDEACRLLERGETERARMLFRKLARERPEDFETLQDIAVIFREKGLLQDYAGLVDMIMKNLVIHSRFDEAANVVLEAVRCREPLKINHQCLMRIARWLAGEGLFGEAHDIYRFILAGCPSPQVSVKASLSLAKILNESMNNPIEALEILVRAQASSPGGDWQERLSQAELLIKQQNKAIQSAVKL